MNSTCISEIFLKKMQQSRMFDKSKCIYALGHWLFFGPNQVAITIYLDHPNSKNILPRVDVIPDHEVHF